MASVMLHNLCNDVSDPCLPRWRLHVKISALSQSKLRRSKIFNLFDAISF